MLILMGLKFNIPLKKKILFKLGNEIGSYIGMIESFEFYIKEKSEFTSSKKEKYKKIINAKIKLN